MTASIRNFIVIKMYKIEENFTLCYKNIKKEQLEKCSPFKVFNDLQSNGFSQFISFFYVKMVKFWINKKIKVLKKKRIKKGERIIHCNIVLNARNLYTNKPTRVA